MNDNENMETVINEPSEPQEETPTPETMDPINEPTEPTPETTDPTNVLIENTELLPMDVNIVKQQGFYTEFQTPNGNIQIIHEIGIGEIVTSVLMATILIFLILDKFVRR